MAIIDRALAKAGVALQSIDRIAVSIALARSPASASASQLHVALLFLSVYLPSASRRSKSWPPPISKQIRANRSGCDGCQACEVYLQSFDSTDMRLASQWLQRSKTPRRLPLVSMAHRRSGAALLRSEPPGEAGDRFPIATIAGLALALVGEKPKPLYLRGPDVRPQAGFAVARK